MTLEPNHSPADTETGRLAKLRDYGAESGSCPWRTDGVRKGTAEIRLHGADRVRGAGSAGSLLETIRDFPLRTGECRDVRATQEENQPSISVTILGYMLVSPHDYVSSRPHVLLCIQPLAFSVSISSGRGEDAMEAE